MNRFARRVFLVYRFGGVTFRRCVALAAIALTAGVMAFVARSGARRDATPLAEANPPELALNVLEKDPDGRLCAAGTSGTFTGWMTERYAGGALMSRTAVSNGLLEGVSEGYFTNGVLQVREYFKAGVKEGPRTTWYANGRKRSEGMLAAGQNDGLYRLWHDDGMIEAEAYFKDGKPHGLSLAWYPSGSLKAEAMMDRGEVKERHTYEDGECNKPGLLARSEIR